MQIEIYQPSLIVTMYYWKIKEIKFEQLVGKILKNIEQNKFFHLMEIVTLDQINRQQNIKHHFSFLLRKCECNDYFHGI